MKKAKAIGINHVVLEVGDIGAALEFYGKIFDFSLRGKGETNAFIDLGDQFIQLSLNDISEPDQKRHFGFVVDDREPIRAVLEEMGVELLERGLNFRDPWGNRIEVVPYDDIQFSKAPNVLRGMELDHLSKTEDALEQLKKKGMGV
ncbi:MAG: VOC family protein [Rhodospirillaceae bacterium]|jgi:lactoylglutathione lyase|nr:VOC family protein [Rhodospirillaceae bacterium]MBT5939724.1 VOC family protein [Rhodospirillaceae bacterium]